MLDKAGYIYTSEHEGWYCVSEEAFYPKSGVQMARDPATGRKIMVFANLPDLWNCAIAHKLL